MKILVLSDTHSKYREELNEHLIQCDLIIHAGDVGNHIIEKLSSYAPLIAVQGNIDIKTEAQVLGHYLSIYVGQIKILLLHNIDDLKIHPLLNDCKDHYNMIIYGHSHIPKVVQEQQIIYLNPGSIGPKRFKNPISYVLLEINGNDIKYKQYEL